MKNLPKIVKTKAIIRFQDCDPFNHLNNGKYLDYFMNAREDQVLENYDLDVYKYATQTGNSWVVGSNQIAYLKPAILMESIVIDSQLFNYTEKNIFVELRMWDKDQTALKAIMWSTFVHYNLLSGTSAIHDPKLMELFENIKYPLAATNFENRVQELKSSFKKIK